MWSYLKFSDKMDLTIQTKMLNNVKDRHTICLKYGDRFLTSSIMLRLEAKDSICSTMKENLILYCKFSVFVVTAISLNKHILITSSISKRTPLGKEIVTFATKSLVF